MEGREEVILKNEVLDLLTEYAANERLSRIVEDDEELMAARIHAEEKYTSFKSVLNGEQRMQLEEFLSAESEEVARMEFLTYQQGLKDMFNLLMSLLDKQEEQACIP